MRCSRLRTRKIGYNLMRLCPPAAATSKVRPSLEAIGFDISKTAKDLLGLEIKWSQDGFIPEYLTLVCGIFYNLKSADNFQRSNFAAI